MLWGVLWRSKNKMDGVREHLVYNDCVPVIFTRKRQAVAYIREHFSYIATRRDLRAEPHGWRMPIPVRVEVKANL